MIDTRFSIQALDKTKHGETFFRVHPSIKSDSSLLAGWRVPNLIYQWHPFPRKIDGNAPPPQIRRIGASTEKVRNASCTAQESYPSNGFQESLSSVHVSTAPTKSRRYEKSRTTDVPLRRGNRIICAFARYKYACMYTVADTKLKEM